MGVAPRKHRRLFISALAGLVLFTPSTFASQQPFLPARTATPAPPAALVRRQSGGCIANFYSCASNGAAWNGVCCQNGQICALDASNNPACCPANVVCTGTAPSTFATPAPTQAVSFVPNAYFSFPYAQTSFANAGACSAAVSQCSVNYNACTSQLEGQVAGGYGVTIIVPGGGGTTVAGGSANVGTASATGICSSLSSQACGGLQANICTNSGVTMSGFYIGTSSSSGAGARPTAGVICNRIGVAGAVAAGVGLGVMQGF